MRFIDLSKPWLIEQGAARTYLRFYRGVLERHAAGLPLKPEGEEGEKLRQQSPVYRGLKNVEKRSGNRIPTGEVNSWGEPILTKWTFRDGVATIDCIGPIIRHYDSWSAMSGMVSTEELAKQLTQALQHESVKSIIFNFDSPGGEAAGIAELANYIRQGVQDKPIVAYADGLLCSAAYWLGSACQEIVINETAIAGSIGTIMAWLDDTKFLEQEGFEEIEFISTQSPLKNPDPKSKDGKAEYQRLVDDMTAVFGSAVAAYRDTTPENVFANFGRGGVMVGERAVRAGLGDRLGDYESLLAELAGGSLRPRHTAVPLRSAVRLQSTNLKSISEAASKTVAARTSIPANQGGAMDPNADEREEEQDEIPADEHTEDPEADEPEDSEDTPDETPEDEETDEDPDEDLSAEALEPTAENIARLQSQLRSTSRRMAAQQQQLAATKKAQALSAREKFTASLEGKVAPAARKSMRTLFNALQSGKATTAHLEAVIEALPKSRAFTSIDADLSPVERPKAADPMAKDVEAANEFAERENARRRGK